MSVDYRDNHYHDTRHNDLINDQELRHAWAHFAKLAYFSDLRDSMSVLEYGAGLGNNLLALKPKDKIYAYEPSSRGIEIAKADGILAFDNLADLPCKSFDMVLCRHVLEHVQQPKTTLEEIRDMLKPGATLTLVLPVDPLSQKPKVDEKNFHLYCWNPRTIHNLLMECGYRDISYHYEYFGGRRKLLPIYRRFGGTAYAHGVRQIGRIFNFRELVVTAKPATSLES